jgi:hypothetical protein
MKIHEKRKTTRFRAAAVQEVAARLSELVRRMALRDELQGYSGHRRNYLAK